MRSFERIKRAMPLAISELTGEGAMGPGIDGNPAAHAEPMWGVRLALFFMMLSTIRFMERDPLGHDVGWQGVLQLLSVLAAAGLSGVILWRRKALLKPDLYLLAMFGFASFTLASSWRSYWPILSLSKTCAFLAVVLTAAGACARIGPRKLVRMSRKGLIAVLCVGLALGIAGVYPLFLLDEFSARTRFSLFALHPGVIADFAALAILTAGFLPRKPSRWLQLLLFTVNILTSAKGSACGLLVSWVIALTPWRNITRKRVAVTAACLCLLCVLGFLVLYGNADQIFGGPLVKLYGTNLADEILTVNGRVGLWKAAEPLLYKSLGLGFGLDGVREVLLDAFDWSGNSHNGLLELALAGGVPGALLFLCGWFLAFRRAVKSDATVRYKLIAFHVYFLITSIASPIWTTSQFISVFYLTIMNAIARECVKAQEREAHVGSGFLGNRHLEPGLNALLDKSTVGAISISLRRDLMARR